MNTGREGRLPLAYRLSKRYVDRYLGQNNDNPMTNGEWQLLTRALPDARLAFDIGANVGDWARLALRVNPRLCLHCFEPSRRTYERLVEHVASVDVVCNNVGLGSHASTETLHVFSDRAGTNSLYRRAGLQDFGNLVESAEESVRLEVFDAYCEERAVEGPIDFCKIDVEGHELEVLKGMSRALERQAIHIIQFEYGGCNIDSRVLLKDLFELLVGRGYELCKIYPGGLRPVGAYSQRLENFQYQNWVALSQHVPRERRQRLME